MYSLVKYNDLESMDDDKIIYINPDCAIKILLDYIRQELGLDINKEFDLCNDDAELQFVNDYEPDMRATQILTPLTTYMVILIERAEDGQFSKLTPLVSKISNKRSDITLRIKRYINPSKRFSYDLSKKSKRSSDFGNKSTISSESTKPHKKNSKKSDNKMEVIKQKN